MLSKIEIGSEPINQAGKIWLASVIVKRETEEKEEEKKRTGTQLNRETHQKENERWAHLFHIEKWTQNKLNQKKKNKKIVSLIIKLNNCNYFNLIIVVVIRFNSQSKDWFSNCLTWKTNLY